MSRKLGAFLCLLGLLGVCVAALTLSTSGPFAGLPGIESDLQDRALEVLGTDAPGAAIDADGRTLRVDLPEVVGAGFDRDAVEARLSAIDGVRSVELNGTPTIAVAPSDAPEPAPAPTEVPEPTELPEEPTAVPEPTPEPTTAPEPTADPEPAAPSLTEIVAGLDAGAIEFDGESANLTGEDQALLDQIAGALVGQSGGPIQVQAHTDNIGDPDVNLLLSQDRADAVVNYLTLQGVDSSLLSARGFGSSQPIADNSTEQGRADNQRVAFVVEGN